MIYYVQLMPVVDPFVFGVSAETPEEAAKLATQLKRDAHAAPSQDKSTKIDRFDVNYVTGNPDEEWAMLGWCEGCAVAILEGRDTAAYQDEEGCWTCTNCQRAELEGEANRG